MARRPLSPDAHFTFRNLLVPALAVGGMAVLLRDPRTAFFEGTTAIMLVTAGAVDSRTGYLFDTLTLPCGAICGAATLVARSAPTALATLFEVVGPLALLASLSRGAWLGWGDVKACISLALAFGPHEAPPALFLASISGLVSAYSGKRERSRAIPFGPHLARGATLTLVLAPLAYRLEGFAR